MSTRVIVGVSTWRDYNFLAPMTGLLWREVIGYEPFFLLAGGWTLESLGGQPILGRVQRCLEALRTHSFEFQVLGTPLGFSEVTLAQNCRQHAAVLPFTDETWLVPTDADLWPIRREFYQAHERAGRDVQAVLYYSNGDHGQSFPTCHTAMRAKTWRELYGLKVWGSQSANGLPQEGDLASQTRDSITRWVQSSPMYAASKDKNMALWCSDQWMATEKIRSAPWYPVGAQHIERRGHPPQDRIDRGHWPTVYGLTAYVDAHLPKDPDGANWGKVRELFVRLLPKHTSWVDFYRDLYQKGY